MIPLMAGTGKPEYAVGVITNVRFQLYAPIALVSAPLFNKIVTVSAAKI